MGSVAPPEDKGQPRIWPLSGNTPHPGEFRVPSPIIWHHLRMVEADLNLKLRHWQNCGWVPEEAGERLPTHMTAEVQVRTKGHHSC